MNSLANKELRMNSVEVCELINEFRELECGRSELTHSDLMKKIRKELEVLKLQGLADEGNFVPSEYMDKKGELRLCYLLNKEGLKMLSDATTSSDKKAIQNAYESVGGSYSEIYCRNRFEVDFFNKLSVVLGVLNIELQTQYSVLKYRVDGYLPKHNIVIEYDERHHNNCNQKSADVKRELEIIDELGCKIVRLDYQNSDCYNIGVILNEILVEKI